VWQLAACNVALNSLVNVELHRAGEPGRYLTCTAQVALVPHRAGEPGRGGEREGGELLCVDGEAAGERVSAALLSGSLSGCLLLS
jgi:hypothetical protein